MIAADTSTWIAFLEGERAPDTELLDQALRDRQLLMVPVVLTELLSDPNTSLFRSPELVATCRRLKLEASIGSELELCEPKFWRSDDEHA